MNYSQLERFKQMRAALVVSVLGVTQACAGESGR